MRLKIAIAGGERYFEKRRRFVTRREQGGGKNVAVIMRKAGKKDA